MGKKMQAEKFYHEFLKAFMVDHDVSKTLSFIMDNVSAVNVSTVLSGKQALEVVIRKRLVEVLSVNGFVVEQFLFSEVDEKNYSLMAEVLLQKNDAQEINGNLRLLQGIWLHCENQEMKIAMIHSQYQVKNTKETIPLNNCEEDFSVYKEAWEHFGNPLCITDLNRNIVYLNKESLDILQKPLEQCLGKPCKDIWNHDICGTMHCGIECLNRGVRQTAYDLENKQVKIEISYLKNAAGDVIGYMELGSDVTEIEELTERFQSMSANIPGGVCQIRLDEYYTLLYGNDAFYELFGCTKERMHKDFQNRLLKYMSAEGFSEIRNAFLEAKKLDQRDITIETKLLRPDGLEVWVLVRATFVKNKTVVNVVIIDITERKTMEQELRISAERLRAALERNSTNVFDYDFRTKQMMQTDAIASMYDMQRAIENAPESILESGVICEESVEDFLNIYMQIERGVPSVSAMIKTIAKNGEIRFNRFSMSGIIDENGVPIRAIGLIEDITEQQNMEDAFLQEAQYRSVMLLDVLLYFEMNLSKDSYYKCKGDWNLAFEGEKKFRYSLIHDETLKHFVPEEYKQAYTDMFSIENAMESFRNGKMQFSLEYPRYMSEGKLLWVSSTMNLVRDLTNGDIKGFMYVKDIDTRKKTELLLVHTSSHDALTGLLNKACTEASVREALKVHDKQHAFLIIDIDHFKSINDNYGHYIGDSILTEVANSLTFFLREEDFIGRIGGDEFVIFIRNIPGISYVIDIAEKVCKNFWSSLVHKEDFPLISCSIGISISVNDGNTFEDLYRNADSALYKAKQLGRNQFVQYHSSFRENRPTNDTLGEEL